MVNSVPIYEIWNQATRSNIAPTVFICLLVLIAFFALNGCQQTASRLTWAFARDDALAFSKYLGIINPRFQVPIYALCANSAVVFIIGCIYLASSTAFNALIGTGLVLQQVSFCFPAALLLYRRRSATYLPANRVFKLGIFGWVSNAATVIFGIVTLIFYSFPSEMPATGGNMSESFEFSSSSQILTLSWFRLHMCCCRHNGYVLFIQLVLLCENTLSRPTTPDRFQLTNS